MIKMKSQRSKFAFDHFLLIKEYQKNYSDIQAKPCSFIEIFNPEEEFQENPKSWQQTSGQTLQIGCFLIFH